MSALAVRLVLVAPPAGVDFALQRGKAAKAAVVQVQRSAGDDLFFDLELKVTEATPPNFTGPFAQGPASERFVYICVGTCAGQTNTPWTRRIKVPLQAISMKQVAAVIARPGTRLQARIPGTGKDGTPSCATVKLLGAWEVVGAD